MNKLSPIVVAGIGAFAAACAFAGDPMIVAQQTAIEAMQAGAPPEGNTTAVQPEERAKLKAEKAARKETASSLKPEEKAAQKAMRTQERKEAAKNPPPFEPEGNTTTVFTDERGRLQGERAAKKEASSQMTREQKRAAGEEMQRQADELEEFIGGDR